MIVTRATVLPVINVAYKTVNCLFLVVNSEWLSTPEGVSTSIPLQYFCESKLAVWSDVADRAVEACRTARTVLGRYFDTHQRDIISQLVGRVSNQSPILTAATYICRSTVQTVL